MLQMRRVDSYALKNNVFSLFLNMSSEMSGARGSAGRLFHDPRSLNSEATVVVVCSRTWNSQSSRASRSKMPGSEFWLLTPAHSTSEGTVGPCRADTCRPELRSWTWCAVELVTSEDCVEWVSYALIFWFLWRDERQRSGSLALAASVVVDYWHQQVDCWVLQQSSRLLTTTCTSVFVAAGVNDCLIDPSRPR